MKKIMFNDRFVLTQAVLDGRKTMTRREITIKSLLDFMADDIKHFFDGGVGGFQAFVNMYAKYKVGEVVAIAQSYNCLYDFSAKAQGIVPFGHLKGWNNKMFVKADLMPHHIQITNIRVERLQDISDEDCLREGIMPFGYFLYSFGKLGNEVFSDNPKTAFSALINRVSGKGTWERNPWVYVYEFKLVD